VFVFFMPNSLIEPANNIPANPMQTPNHIVPEWYFLPFYAILRSVPNMVGGVLAMGLSVMIFAFMPFLDRSRIPGGAHFRPIYKLQFFLFIADMFVLGYVGYVPPTSQTIMIGQIATLCYFGSFFLIPFISKAEEAWLIKRGLPPEVTELIEKEARDKEERTLKTSPSQRRHSMKTFLQIILLSCISLSAWANEAALDKVDVETDSKSIERGAEAMMGACHSCHSMKYIHYRDLLNFGMD
jgi:hypothetical protein